MLKSDTLLMKDTSDVTSVQIMASTLHQTDVHMSWVVLMTLWPPSEVTP